MPLYYITNPRGYKNILKLIIPYILIIGTFQLIGFYFAGGYDFKNLKIINQSSGQLFLVTFFTFLGTMSLLWFFRKYVDKRTFSSLGFNRAFIAKDIIIGIIFGFIIMLAAFTSLILTN